MLWWSSSLKTKGNSYDDDTGCLITRLVNLEKKIVAH